MSNMNVLVTGAAGFIGSHTVLKLLQTGFKVIAVDNCINAIIGEQETLPESLKRVENLSGVKLTKFYLVDLTNADAVKKIFKSHSGQIGAVIHLAALKAVGESCVIPLRYYENNILATINLVRAMQETGVNKFIFSSSATVYGKPQYLPLDENHPTGVSITNPYGRTKHFIEEILKDVVEASKFPVKNNDSNESSNPQLFNVISLRYFNPVGAHESGEIGEDPRGVPNNLMPFIAQVAVGRRAKLSVFGSDFNTPDGTGVRDYIHICDLASGHVAAVERILSTNNVEFEVFNLGSGKGHSVLEVLSSFSAACGKQIPHEMVDRRAGDVDCIYAECSKAREILKWQTHKSLDQMCKDTWRWQSKYPHGFQTENNNIYSTPSNQ